MHYTGPDMLWLIGSLSRVFRIPFDAQLISQQFPPPYSRTSLLNALQALDFKIGEMELDEEGIATLERIPFPVVAFVREDEEVEPHVGRAMPDMVGVAHPTAARVDVPDTLSPPATPVLLVKADEERVLFFCAGADEPETIPLSEFSKHFRQNNWGRSPIENTQRHSSDRR